MFASLLTISLLFTHDSIFAVGKRSSFAPVFHSNQSGALRVHLGRRQALCCQLVSHLWKVMKWSKPKWKCPSPCLGVTTPSAVSAADLQLHATHRQGWGGWAGSSAAPRTWLQMVHGRHPASFPSWLHPLREELQTLSCKKIQGHGSSLP